MENTNNKEVLIAITDDQKPDPVKEDQIMEAMEEPDESRMGRHLQRLEAPADVLSLLTPEVMQMQMEVETKKREILNQFIARHMVEGVDYGKIHIGKDCQNKYNCTNKYHFSKDTLFKAGGEKFCSLFRLRAEFAKDDETWEMLGRKPGLICLVCRLYTPSGVLAGEGRGAASVEEKGNPNTAIKIAEKRAKLDAVLATGGLSDFFSQDLEEMQDEEESKQTDQKVKIMALVKRLGVPANSKSEYEAVIKSITQLNLVPKNYPDILARLEVSLQEQREAETEVERLKTSNAAAPITA